MLRLSTTPRPLLSLLLLAGLTASSACDGAKEDAPPEAAPEAKADEAPEAAAEEPATATPEPDGAAPDGAAPESSGDDGEAPIKKLNLNTATEDEFKTIPNVGGRMAHEFEEYRPWVSVAQFRKEIGKYVDADAVAEFEKYVFVPVDMNASDALTLQQLPGVDAAAAEAIIAGRPYADAAAFKAKLESLTSKGAAAEVDTMLAPAK